MWVLAGKHGEEHLPNTLQVVFNTTAFANVGYFCTFYWATCELLYNCCFFFSPLQGQPVGANQTTIATNASVLANTHKLVDGERLLCCDQWACWPCMSVQWVYTLSSGLHAPRGLIIECFLAERQWKGKCLQHCVHPNWKFAAMSFPCITFWQGCRWAAMWNFLPVWSWQLWLRN